MGTDWRDNDPEVEPMVEIYQGHRHNYEHLGAPRSPTEADPDRRLSSPRASSGTRFEKGYRLGFESSSDHVSTHLSYAIVYAEDTTRPALIEAFKKRHCYAATDNILLDVRSRRPHHGRQPSRPRNGRASRSSSRGPPRWRRSTSSATTGTSTTTEPNARDVATSATPTTDAETGRSHLLLRPRRAGRRQPRLGVADVDHLQTLIGNYFNPPQRKQGRPLLALRAEKEIFETCFY